ncbi:archaemetzincin family Zn-dependent metalloprotease [candidate division KSB1 bacterium]|nr:archaemetzincin family Zn-dependent metalloprotease [candidate division KSB1 bacterium]
MSNKIYLAFINEHFPPFWENLAQDLNRCVHFKFEHIRLKIDLNLFYSLERQQYHSTLILSQILKFLPADAHRIVGITQVDLYIPILTFLFGEAQFNGAGALVSTFRLNNKFYGLPKDDQLLYLRTQKEIMHELGHTFGLTHCQNFKCVMHSSTYVEDIDLKMSILCQDCQKILGVDCKE